MTSRESCWWCTISSLPFWMETLSIQPKSVRFKLSKIHYPTWLYWQRKDQRSSRSIDRETRGRRSKKKMMLITNVWRIYFPRRKNRKKKITLKWRTMVKLITEMVLNFQIFWEAKKMPKLNSQRTKLSNSRDRCCQSMRSGMSWEKWSEKTKWSLSSDRPVQERPHSWLSICMKMAMESTGLLVALNPEELRLCL